MLFLRGVLHTNVLIAGTGPSFGGIGLAVSFASHSRRCNESDGSLMSAGCWWIICNALAYATVDSIAAFNFICLAGNYPTRPRKLRRHGTP